MTKISEYPILTNPTDDDILIGTDVNSSDETRNFSVGSIVSLANETIKPYKVYTALLTQTGINAPVATVLENTLGSIVWGYAQSGGYTGTLIGAFIVGKTHLQVQQTLWGSERQQTSIDYNDIDSVIIQTYDNGQNDSIPIDDALRNTSIEIRVYN
jgi:hypothetical protein